MKLRYQIEGEIDADDEGDLVFLEKQDAYSLLTLSRDYSVAMERVDD